MTLNGKTADSSGHGAGAVTGVAPSVVRVDARPHFRALMWPPGIALAWDAFLSLLFFAQHSGMVRRPFRARLARVLPSATTARSTRSVSG